MQISEWIIVPMLLALGILLGCGTYEEDKSDDGLTPSLVAMTVNDLEKSTKWYIDFGFETDTLMSFPDYGVKINILKLQDFRLELISFDEKVQIDRSKLPSEYSNIHGLIKIGFLTSNLDSLWNSVKNSDIEVIVVPSELPPLKSGHPWPKNFALVKDPDGNYVQFFEGNNDLNQVIKNERGGLTPFLIMISVADFQSNLMWYEKLGFKTLEKLQSPGNQRAVLSNSEFIIEIGSFDSDISLLEVGLDSGVLDKAIRISKMGFSTNKMDSLFTTFSSQNYSIPYQNIEGDDRYFIVKDLGGNYVQIFGF